MLRNTILYHRLWYIKKRNAKLVHIYLKLIIVLAVFIIAINCSEKKLFPKAIDLSESQAKTVLTSVIDSIINENSLKNITGVNLVYIKKDGDGNVVSVEMNGTNLKNISDTVVESARRILSDKISSDNNYVIVPFSTLTGGSIFTWHKPGRSVFAGQKPGGSLFSGQKLGFLISYNLNSNIATEFRSETVLQAGNKLLYRLILRVTAKLVVSMPLERRQTKVTVDVPFFEILLSNYSDSSSCLFSLAS